MKYGYYLFFAFLTLLTPLAFGGSEPWGLFTFNLSCLCFAFFILFKRREFVLTSVSKAIISLLVIIIFLAFLQLLNQHNFLQKPAYFPFTLCKYYSLEGLSLLFSLAMLYFALTQVLQRSKEIKALAVIITINAVITALVSISFRTEFIEFFTDIKISSAFGPFTSRNHGAQFVMTAFFISLLVWLPRFILTKNERWPNRNIWACICSVILFISIFFAHSRGGVIALVLGLFVLCVLCFLHLFRNTKKKILYLTVSALIFMILIHFIITHSTALGLRDFWTGSDTARLTLYKTALDMLEDFPFTGVGFDAFSAAIDAYIPFALKTFPRYLHNDWLELLLSFGYVAGVIIFGFIGLIIFRIVQNFKGLETKKQLRLFIVCAALSGFCFTGLVDFPFHLPACAILFFFLLAFVSSVSFNSKVTKVCIPLAVKIILFFLAGVLLMYNFQYVRAWRNFIFVKQFAPRIQAQELSRSVHYYPSPIYIKHALNGKYKMLKSENTTEEERQEIKEDIHRIAAFYLKQYPKDITLSRFFLLTK